MQDLPVERERPRVPLWLGLTAFILRAFGRGLLFLARHPIVLGLIVAVLVVRIRYGWRALEFGVLVALGLAVVWRFLHRRSFGALARWLRGRWRLAVRYRTRWRHAMVQSGLAIREPTSMGERVAYSEYLPHIRSFRSSGWVDVLRVELLYGQTPQQWAEQAEALRHVFRARACRVRTDRAGFVAVELAFRDPLTRVVPPIDPRDDPTADDPVPLGDLPLGVREDGETWRLGLRGTHVLVAGATGAGKASVIWSAVSALGPAVRAGLVELWVCDPKGGMELAFGAPMFARFAVDLPSIADLLDDAVSAMRDRAGRLRGATRLHAPSRREPLIVVVVDELASLTAYVPDRDLRRRLGASLPLLLSQGRAPGVVVLAAIQDPRKETLPFRDLFPTRIALRMTEPEQVDLVLGDGARKRGARAEEIPTGLPGVGFVQLDGQPEPIRVRASWHDDEEIRATALRYLPRSRPAPDSSTAYGGWVPEIDGEAA